ncbi:MAG TPA: amidohydrolase [Vicinamibacteria bacterium]|nr:amidohydrolase [Vicinamibacteria bacterium]
MFADRVLVRGRIITVDEKDSVVEAVAIRDGRILAVGSAAEILALVGPGTETTDLHGLTATPGLLDAHCHFAGGAFDRLFVLDLSYPRVRSVADVVALVKAERSRPGEWIQGRGWDEGKLAERRYIRAADLDAVAPDRPVWLSHTMGHYGVANSVALERAGITAATPDPPGGTIDRDADGRPTGVLKESAQALVERLIPPASPEQRREAIRQLAREFNEEGMTGLKEPGIGPETWQAYQETLAEGALTVRVFALWHGGESAEETRQVIERIGPFTKPYRSVGDAHLVSGGVKLYMDGSGGARTAWMYDEWNKNGDQVDAGNRGYPTADPELRRSQIRAYHGAGIHVSTHAIGDRAIDWVVDSYALALAGDPRAGLRHGIIHANIPTDRALDRMAELQRRFDAGYPEPSATFTWWIGDTYAGNFGPVRSRRLNPFRSYLERGMLWAAGSDFNVTPFPARYGLFAAMARETLLGVYGRNPYGMEQSVDLRSALRSHTIWAARQMFLERRIGSIEVGKEADIAVWDTDLYAATPEQVRDMTCVMTLFQGRVVHRAPESKVTEARPR